MDMPHRLASSVVTVIHNPKAVVGKAFLSGNLRCNLINMSNQFIVSAG